MTKIDDILNELAPFFERPPMLDGDISVDMLMERFGVSHNGAIYKMKALERSGKYTLKKVFSNGAWKRILRKIPQSALQQE